MEKLFSIKRTSTGHQDFRLLVEALDHELWDELKEDQATYDQYNKLPDIKTAVLVYTGKEPVACGCFKEYDKETVEVKRMFVKKDFRGKGFSKMVLTELERWAISLGYKYAVLETSIHFATACRLYQTNDYIVVENYGSYASLPESVCMKKKLGVH